MDRKELLALAKSIQAHVEAHPEELQKFLPKQPAPAAAPAPAPAAPKPAPKPSQTIARRATAGLRSRMRANAASSPMTFKEEPAAKCGTGMMKDDQPHPPNSPEDKAHDVVEHKEPLKQALRETQPPKSRLLAHLRSYGKAKQHGQSPEWKRSPHNEAAGDPRLALKAEVMAKYEPKFQKAALAAAPRPGASIVVTTPKQSKKPKRTFMAAFGTMLPSGGGTPAPAALGVAKGSKEPGAKPVDASRVVGAGKPAGLPAGPVKTKPPHKGRN